MKLKTADGFNWRSRVSKALAAAILCGATVLPAAAAPETDAGRERHNFDNGWLFIKDDPAGLGDELNYPQLKKWMLPTANDFTTNPPASRPDGDPGADVAYVQAGFDDHAWRQLNLPHDWGIEGPFKQEYASDTGKLPYWGVGWYRKHFVIPASDQGRQIQFDVDGAMSYANVWLNGHYVGGWPYGYASWQVDLTPYLNYGGDNVLAVRLDNPPESSRWYPGGGIYRNVWLEKTGPIHVAHWGTYVTTPVADATNALVKIKMQVDNDSDGDVNVSSLNEVFELKANGQLGTFVAGVQTDGVQVGAHGKQSSAAQVGFPHPKLWSPSHPQRYALVTTLTENGRQLDSYQTPFGIRTIKFDPDGGFFLNGEHVRLNGVCDHHDLGALGAALNVRALQRQIEILKQMGCNAIRTSHNPPAPELLDLCDQMGMLVMDESFDCWARGKRPNDYHLLFNDWHEKDWRAELRRDRNHPSIILWSIGNEIPEQTSSNGPAMGAELTAIAHQEDPTRPTTAACNEVKSAFNGFGASLDVFGYNYHPTLYGRAHKANPNQPIFGSETASCISTRGEYVFPVSTNKSDGKADFQVSSYDLYAPHWATPPDWEFAGQDKYPYVAGEFVWTGFDYLGEPTPYNADTTNLPVFTDPVKQAQMKAELAATGKILVPSRSSYFGIVDLAGFKKDRFYLYQSRWLPDLPMAHLVPQCWNWPNRIGQVTPVHVYTSGDEAELFLNGQSLGRKKKDPHAYRIIWDDVVYAPGKLKVVAYKDGKKWATDVVETTGPATRLVLKADHRKIQADGRDLSYVTATVEDAKGRLVPLADNALHFEVSGPGEIVATDNGDPTDLTVFQSPDRQAFNGLALAILRSHAPGKTMLKVSSPGLAPAELSIQAQ